MKPNLELDIWARRARKVVCGLDVENVFCLDAKGDCKGFCKFGIQPVWTVHKIVDHGWPALENIREVGLRPMTIMKGFL